MCKSARIGGKMIFADYDIYYLIPKVLKLIFFVLNSRKLALNFLEFVVLVYSNMH